MKAGVPIGLGYFAVSFAFGIMGVEGGLSVFDTTMISLLNLTSAGQFAGLNVMLAHGSLIELALTQLIINLRYSLMSFSLSQKVEQTAPTLQRMIMAFGITDEIYAVCAAEEGRLSLFFAYGAMALAIPGWTLGTFSGAFLGSVLPERILSALSVALYGMFIAIIIPPAKKRKTVAGVVICAMALSALFAVLPVLKTVSSGFVIIITTLVTAGAFAYFFPVTEEEAET
ncbi:MAG: AzlC family ABC transporter permease [Lachnospiraceae bacterium]|nr:AzlC family ABC transporter permease [Lachnospiraceae bacterium]